MLPYFKQQMQDAERLEARSSKVARPSRSVRSIPDRDGLATICRALERDDKQALLVFQKAKVLLMKWLALKGRKEFVWLTHSHF